MSNNIYIYFLFFFRVENLANDIIVTSLLNLVIYNTSLMVDFLHDYLYRCVSPEHQGRRGGA